MHNDGDPFDEGPEPASSNPAPPPPPPPPSRKGPGETDLWVQRAIATVTATPTPGGTVGHGQHDLARKVDDLRAWVERLDREVASLKGGRADGAVAQAPAPAPDTLAGNTENKRLRDELDRLRRELEQEQKKPAASGGDELLKEQLAAAEKALEIVRAELKAAQDANEKVEGELQSLRLQTDETKEKTKEAIQAITDLRLTGKAEQMLKALVRDRDALQEQRDRYETDLARLKGEATRRIGMLKGELDKSKNERETVKTQKDNLMKQLMARDAQLTLDKPREITLEDITSSDIFKQMLGNIRRTSRLEVTTIHDAIATIKEIDPKAYEVVLEVVAKHFQKAQIENPLATLPRK